MSMAEMFDYLAQHRVGVEILILSAFAVVLLVQWVSWIFVWGRFKARNGHQDLRVVITDFFVKIIDDFRHLLALVVVLVFLVALVMMLWPGVTRGDMGLMETGLKAVVATLGSLLAAIIGYYFGESAGSKARAPGVVTTTEQTPEMPASGQRPASSLDIRPAPAPPPKPSDGGQSTGGA